MEKSSEPLIFIVPEKSSLELNFRSYHFAEESAVFIPSGQYVSADDTTKQFSVNAKFQSSYRYLFSQVLTLGHVQSDAKFANKCPQDLLEHSSKKWKKLNPFNTTEDELDLLFDVNDWLEENLEANLELKNGFLSLKEIQKLSKEKLQLTLFQWKNHKLVNQARQTLYDTAGSIKETSYLLGFKDPAYFCRFFKNHTTISPGEFVKGVEEKPWEDRVFSSFRSLLQNEVMFHHDVSYYANELNFTSKSLSRIIKHATGATPKEHITNELISRARKRLTEGQSVTNLAFELGFEEISHFSNFFRHYTGLNPSEFSKSTIN